MPNNESAPKPRERMLVKLSDLQKYHYGNTVAGTAEQGNVPEVDTAKRDEFRREFAKTALTNLDVPEHVRRVKLANSESVANLVENELFPKVDADGNRYDRDGNVTNVANAEDLAGAPHRRNNRQNIYNKAVGLDSSFGASAVITNGEAPAQAVVNGEANAGDSSNEKVGLSTKAYVAKESLFSKLADLAKNGTKGHQERIAQLREAGEDSKADRKVRWGRIRRGLGAVAIAAGVAYTIHRFGTSGGGSHHEAATDANNLGDGKGGSGEHGALAALHEQTLAMHEHFNVPDPSLATDKLLPNDFNHPIPNGNNLPAFKEALDLQMRGSGEEMAMYLSKARIDGAPLPENFPDSSSYARALDEYGKFLERPENIQLRTDKLNELNGMFNSPDATFTVRDINNPYVSPYMQNGNLGIDDYVDYGGTVTEVRLPNGAVINVRNECGQPIDEIIRQYTAQPVAQGGGPAPVAESFTQATHTQPTGEAPQGGGPGPSPTNPGSPSNPGNPGTPTNPGNPGNPGTPTEPGSPEVPTVPSDEKDWDRHIDPADGIDPALNNFIEWTKDPLQTGNGTQSPNLQPGWGLPGAADNSYNAGGAQNNTSPQIAVPESGAGVNVDAPSATDTANAQAQQNANNAANSMESQMSQPGATDQAVKDAISQMGADGNPK